MPQAIPAVVAAISYVGSSAAAVVAGTATLAQIATVAAVGIGAGVGGIAAAKALTPQISSQGAAVTWEANPDAPLHFAFGRVGVKGKIFDAAIYGPDRMYVSFACTVSAAGPIKRFVNFRAGDYYMTFNGSGQATTEPYAGEMWLSTRLGAQPDTALSLPSGLKNSAAFPGWDSSRKLSGSACYMVTLGENSKRSAYEGKVPAFVTVIEGLYCYDPRLDDTYPGGEGDCRLDDPDTWVWTENPIIFGLKWALGLWEGPVGKGAPQVDYQVGGIGAKIDGIHLASFVEAANVADANGWKGAAWPSTDDDKAQVLDAFLKAGGAKYAEIAGKIACIHRAAARAPVFTVTGRDTAGPIEIDTASSKLNRINTIRPRYWAEDQEWEMTALPEVTSTEWQEEDGQGVAVKRTRGVDYTFVPLPKQARELASLEISNSREGIKGRVPLRPYMDPEPGNTFIFDEPDFALSDLKCIVLEVEDDTENDTVIVTFETETDGKYPYAYGQTDSPPPPQELDPYDPTYVIPPEAGDWTITPRPPSTGGGQLPGFDLSGVVSNDTATAIIVEYGPTSTGPWTQAYQGPPTVTNIPIDGLQSGETYYIAIRYQRNQNYSDRHVYGPYTAPVLDPGPNAPTLAEIFGDIGDLDDALALFDADLATLEGELSAQGADIASLEVAISDETTARAAAIRQLQAAASGGSINANPNFAAFPDGASVPTNWTAWGRQDNARVAGRFSAYGFQQHDNTGGVQEDCGLVQTYATWPGLTGVAPGYYVIEVDVRLVAGGYRGAGVLLYAGSLGVGSVATLHLGAEPDVNGQVGHTTALPSRSFRKLVHLENVSTGNLTCHLMTNWSAGFGVQDPKIIVWDHCAVRPATDAEIAAGTVLPGLSASVTAAQAAIVDLEANKASASDLSATQAQVDDLDAETFILQTSVADVTSRLSTAQIDIRAAVGSTPAMVQLKDSASGSVLAMVAQSILLGSYDSGGTLVPVLSLVGTKARFSGDVEIDGNLLLGGSLSGKDKIIKGTVRPAAYSYAAGVVTLSGTARTKVAEVVIATSGSPVIVEFLALMDMKHEPASSFTMYVELRRQAVDGSNDYQVQYEFVDGAGDTADNFTGKWPIKIKDTYPGAGTWRYYVDVWVSASNMTVKNVRNRFMSAEEDLTNT